MQCTVRRSVRSLFRRPCSVRARLLSDSSLDHENFNSKFLKEKKEQLIIEIDRSNLRSSSLPPATHEERKPSFDSLSGYLEMMIQVKGPLTVAEFMKQSLCHPTFGYYTSQNNKAGGSSSIFGKSGDFTTAPEISQMFGELVGIWCIAMWQNLGSPSNVSIVELGPGRGTLMADLLRTARTFPTFYNALSSVHLVDVSKELQLVQKETLKQEEMSKISWHQDLSSVPNDDCCTLYVAQELFDALPVHQFEYTTKYGWCERLIDINSTGQFSFTLSKGATPAVRAYLGGPKKDSAVIKTSDAAAGDVLEVCPSGIALIQDLGSRISKSNGAALIVDYGTSTPSSSDSLRGILNHEFVSPLSKPPGSIDLSIDVDFSTLKRFANEIKGVKAVGPVNQGLFLKEMGIEHRLFKLLENAASEEDAEDLIKSYERLVGDDQMGNIFKVLAMTRKSIDAVAFAKD